MTMVDFHLLFFSDIGWLSKTHMLEAFGFLYTFKNKEVMYYEKI